MEGGCSSHMQQRDRSALTMPNGKIAICKSNQLLQRRKLDIESGPRKFGGIQISNKAN